MADTVCPIPPAITATRAIYDPSLITNSSFDEIEQCVTRPTISVVVPNRDDPVPQTVEVMRRHGAVRAYRLVEGVVPTPLEHGGAIWGHIYLAIALPRCKEDLVFFEPPETARVQRVVIKKFYKLVVHRDLENGSFEDPYTEIARMKMFGDDRHVLRCIEALQDDRFLYIISKHCEQGSLADMCPLPSTPNMSAEARAREIFRQMLDNIEYLHDHGICHRDIDPGNFVMDENGQVVAIDLAMSCEIPANGIIQHNGYHGKKPYWVPEIAHGAPYDARQCDLWGCAVTLFNLLAGVRLYHAPIPNDVLFVYTVMAEGLSRDGLDNELMLEVLDQVHGTPAFKTIARVRGRIQLLSPQARELLQHTLCLYPSKRWTLADIRRSEWMNMTMAN